jgi:hypothetical protein
MIMEIHKAIILSLLSKDFIKKLFISFKICNINLSFEILNFIEDKIHFNFINLLKLLDLANIYFDNYYLFNSTNSIISL